MINRNAIKTGICEEALRSGGFVFNPDFIMRNSNSADKFELGNLSIEQSTAQDSEQLAHWIELNKQDLTYIGGKEGEPADKQFETWIKESIVSFKITYESEILAFAVIDHMGENFQDKDDFLEIGRLVVDPRKRWRGLGSSLVNHLCLSITGYLTKVKHPLKIFVRVKKDNNYALGMLDKLPFTPLQPLSVPDARDLEWRCYNLSVRESLLGDEIRKRRTARGFDTKYSGFLMTTSPQALTNIESDNRLPSLDLLRKICFALGKDQAERIDVLLSALGEKREENIIIGAPLTLPKEKINLWVVSDGFLEITNDDWLKASANSVKGHFDRWYFIPSKEFENIGKKLLSRFREHVSNEKELSRGFLRIYEAPTLVCTLHMAILNPGSQGSSSLDAESITLALDSKIHVPLSKVAFVPILKYFHEVLSEVNKGGDREYEGFKLCYPKEVGK